jgi:hypothetical protein
VVVVDEVVKEEKQENGRVDGDVIRFIVRELIYDGDDDEKEDE